MYDGFAEMMDNSVLNIEKNKAEFESNGSLATLFRPSYRLKLRTRLHQVVDVIRTIEGRFSALEEKGHLRPTAKMELPNRR